MKRLTYKKNGIYMPAPNTNWDTFNKLGIYEDIEEELGIDFYTLIQALKNGIWSKEHLNFENKYSRQEYPFNVQPSFENNDWYFRFNFSSPGSDTSYGPATIFSDRVKISDINHSWALNKKDFIKEP